MRYFLSFAIFISLLTCYSCNNSNNIINEDVTVNKVVKDDQVYIDKGKRIALEAKSILGNSLLKAIQEKETEGALLFCSNKAIYITDSISKALGVKIKRVSDNFRNPINSASDIELEYMAQVRDNIAKGDNPNPQVIYQDNKVFAYFPIMTNAMCLQCHGQKNIDILSNVATKIDSLYPDDNATGYRDNELRGIWIIEMTK